MKKEIDLSTVQSEKKLPCWAAETAEVFLFLYDYILYIYNKKKNLSLSIFYPRDKFMNYLLMTNK